MDQPIFRQCSLSGTRSGEPFDLLIKVTVVPGISDEGTIGVSVLLNGNLSSEDTISLWADCAYDFYDLSICFTYFADQEDTTEELPSSIEDSSYSHRAQWFLGQHLLNQYWFYLAAKKTTKRGVLHVVEFNLFDDNEFENFKGFSFFSQPTELRKFSKDLLDVWEVISKVTTEHPFGEEPV